MLLTPLVEKTAQTRIITAGKASSAEVSLQSQPAVLLLLGEVDTLDAKASAVQIGQVCFQDVTLTGRNIRMDMPSFVMDGALTVRSADQLQMTGILREENLQELLQRKVDRLQNIQVKITPEKVQATAQAKIFGRMADIDLEGTVIEDNNGLYFHMTKLNIRNAVFGKASIGDFFGDILLTKLSALPLKAGVDQVEMQDGQIVVTVSCHNS